MPSSPCMVTGIITIMGSYASLYVNKTAILHFKNESYWGFGELFTEEELKSFNVSDVQDAYFSGLIDYYNEVDDDDFELYLYDSTVRSMKDRLQLMGCSLDLCKRVYDEVAEEKIAELKDSLAKYGHINPEVKLEMESELSFLNGLSFEDWCNKVKQWVDSAPAPKISFRTFIVDEPLQLLAESNELLALRTAIELLNDDDRVTLDLTDVYHGGWIKEVRVPKTALQESYTKSSQPPIIITEGKTDREFILDGLKILKPHLVDKMVFLDYQQKNEGGASAALQLLKGLAAADVKHRVLVILDNDAAAHEAKSSINSAILPDNFKIIHYPDLKFAESYPSRGAQGSSNMDVNGLACSIEMYLGSDVLRDSSGNLYEVVWKNELPKLGIYQGELTNKKLIQDTFRAKVKNALSSGVTEDQDWNGLSLIIDSLIEEISTLKFTDPLI